jgi:transposase
VDKGSTVKSATKLVVGIDLGDRHSHYGVVDHDGRVLDEGKLATVEAAFHQRFSGIVRARIVMEVGTHSPWVSRLLQRLGHDVVVVDPRQVDLISKSDKKTDRHDASTLALLGRLDPDLQLLKTVSHRPQEMQADLAVIRNRDAMVRARTLLINSVRGTVKSYGGRLPACSAPSFHKKALPHVPPALLPVLSISLKQIAQQSTAIADYDRLIVELAATRYPETEVLTRVPGVGTLTALTYVLTIADPHRFKRSRKVGAYLGLVPRLRQSGKRDPELSITKAGDPYLRQILVSAAHYIIGPFGPDTDLRRFGLRLAAAGDKRRAVVALARKLAVLLHHLWVTGAVYEPLRREGVMLAA